MRPTVLLCALVLVAGGASADSISLDTAPPTRGEVVAVSVATSEGDPTGWALAVTYFPNSIIERTDELGRADSLGRIAWLPRFAGLATLTATRGDESVSLSTSVKFPGVPAGAALVFIVAGTILLGGAGWSLIRLAEHEPPPGADTKRTPRLTLEDESQA